MSVVEGELEDVTTTRLPDISKWIFSAENDRVFFHTEAQGVPPSQWIERGPEGILHVLNEKHDHHPETPSILLGAQKGVHASPKALSEEDTDKKRLS
jgi:hypothetical protein